MYEGKEYMYAGTGKGFSSHTHTHTLKKNNHQHNNKSADDRFISAHQKMQSNELVISEKENNFIHR